MDLIRPEREKIIDNNIIQQNSWITPGLLISNKRKNKLFVKAKAAEKNSIIKLKYIKYRNIYNKLIKRAKPFIIIISLNKI